MFFDDMFFHFSHRLLHKKWFYNHIHKIHHQHTMTIGLAGDYAHPLEYMLGNVLPVGLGMLILGEKMHLFTFIIWVTVIQAETADGHSGYEFPWSPYRLLPGATSAEYHDYHHSHNIGNYSSTSSLWDNIFGTNKEYHKYLDKKYNSLKHK